MAHGCDFLRVAPFFAGAVTHKFKVGTLDSSPLPVPPHLQRFRVGSVNRRDFFGWAQVGIVRMTGRTVPAGTVIDSEALTVDPQRLRSLPIRPHACSSDDHQLSFGHTIRLARRSAPVAKAIIAGLPTGWCQVEAVVAAIREGYSHDRSATVPPGCADVVADFLLRSHRGPDYLFASAAAVLLRSLGYPTRVVSGLYAAPWRTTPLPATLRSLRRTCTFGPRCGCRTVPGSPSSRRRVTRCCHRCAPGLT